MNSICIEQVRLAANQIYGDILSDRTWRKWKRLFYVDPHQKMISKSQATLLLTMAHLRKLNSRKKYTQKQIVDYLRTKPFSEKELQEALDAALYSNLQGKQLPTLIRQVTGRQVTIRTIYRWSKVHRLEFGASRVIPREDVDRWLEIAC